MGAKEECGVAGIVLKKGVDPRIGPDLMFRLLWEQRNRGQLSSGFTSYFPGRPRRLNTHKAVKRVDELFGMNLQPDERRAFQERLVKNYKGTAFNGHVRYATSGKGNAEDETQPFVRRHGKIWKRFSFCYNGTLTNYGDLRAKMEMEDYSLETFVDTEVFMHRFSHAISELENNMGGKQTTPDLFEVSKRVMKELDGAYSFVNLFADGNLLVGRDPLGFKPLVWGENSKLWAIASESAALEKVGIDKFYSVPPGSCIVFNENGMEERRLFNEVKRSHCQFEWIYFSRINSVIDDKSVYSVRIALADELARIEPFRERIDESPNDWIVVGIPNSGRDYANQLGRRLGVEYIEAIIKSGGKDEEALRGFINDPDTRALFMGREYSVVRDAIRWKNVILVEDSRVRGETLKEVVSLVKLAEPRSVHVRIAEPPIIAPCFYGIDFPSFGELVANKYGENISIQELQSRAAKDTGVDSLVYQTVKGLKRAVDMGDNICTACLTRDYPTRGGRMLADKAMAKWKNS